MSDKPVYHVEPVAYSDGWITEQPSLGEVPHDATGCHNRGRPHLGPCVDPRPGVEATPTDG